MIIYPAMDLMGGRVVRLKQGRFDDQTTYSPEPAEALATFAEAGAEWAHVVDLDGARAKAPVQHELIASLAQSTQLKLQVGGGFRTRDQVARMLESGVERVVVGSLAVSDPKLVASWIDEFGPEHVTLSLDV
jgi:phosphoribosylformimino-5-aminoimidazole carboxamide ribotide isomerase